jgi:hypothetical protein
MRPFCTQKQTICLTMCDMQGKRERWMELAAQVADEQDPQELSKLVQELARLLAEKRDRLNHALRT